MDKTNIKDVLDSEKIIPNQVFEDLMDLDYCPLPLQFKSESKTFSHPEHKGRPGPDKIRKWLSNGHANPTGIAIKLFPPNGMFDFDIKNTEEKTVFEDWFRSINAIDDSIQKKLCIEGTKSNGFHVYFKYKNLKKSERLASAINGEEVIQIYTEHLSYCTPSPGYHLIHNDFNDIEDLTDEEFDILCSCAVALDREEKKHISSSIVIEYPRDIEYTCLQFDKCESDVFEKVLNSVGLFYEKTKRNTEYGDCELFLRRGSSADFSAKVYYSCNECLLFTSSLNGFPNFHTRKDENDTSWVLTPSRVIYYKNNRDWKLAFEEIKSICETAGIDLTPGVEFVEPKLDGFPIHIFPKKIRQFIETSQLNIQEFLAADILVAASTAIGNSCKLVTKDRNYLLVIYMATVGSPGSGKSPALQKAFAPLEKYDEELRKRFALSKEFEDGSKDKKKISYSPQVLMKDFTIETIAPILSKNTIGCAVVADELSGFVKRINRYGENDDLAKWLEMFTSQPILVQRILREECKVSEPFCNIVGGIQPGILHLLADDGRDSQGFHHRFLIVYPEEIAPPDWEDIQGNEDATKDYHLFIDDLLKYREEPQRVYRMDKASEEAFGVWYDKMNRIWMGGVDENQKGVVAKYKDYYCLRLALLVEVINGDGIEIISLKSMEDAIELMEYFLSQMRKASRSLSPGSPADSLPRDKKEFYNNLPELFSLKKAIEVGKSLKMDETAIRNFISYQVGKTKDKLFEKDKIGTFRRLYWGS